MPVRFYFNRERKEMLKSDLAVSGEYKPLREWTVKISFRGEIELHRDILYGVLIP